MKYNQYEIEGNVWMYPGMGGWYFVTVPQDVSEDIKKMFHDRAKAWGSLPVRVRVGETVWNTSLFPDKKLGAYLLPLKAEVRKKESISLDQTVRLLVEVNS